MGAPHQAGYCEPAYIVLEAGEGFLMTAAIRDISALKAGVTAFLQKPVDNAELLAVLRRTLGGPAVPKKLAYLSEPARRKFLL
jgi:FixJ family two-component response regulator